MPMSISPPSRRIWTVRPADLRALSNGFVPTRRVSAAIPILSLASVCRKRLIIASIAGRQTAIPRRRRASPTGSRAPRTLGRWRCIAPPSSAPDRPSGSIARRQRFAVTQPDRVSHAQRHQEAAPARKDLPRLPAAIRVAQEMGTRLGLGRLLLGRLPPLALSADQRRAAIHASHSQPAISRMPPIGVIAPNHGGAPSAIR